MLSDPQKRQQYDQFGHAAFEQGGAGAGGFGGGFGGFDLAGIWVISSAISLVIFWRRQIREGQKRTFTGRQHKDFC